VVFLAFTILIRLLTLDSGKGRSKQGTKALRQSTPAGRPSVTAPVPQLTTGASMSTESSVSPTPPRSRSTRVRTRAFSTALSAAFALGIVVSLAPAVVLADAPTFTCADSNPTCNDIVEFVNGEQNDAAYWDAYFDNHGHPDYVCTKINETPFPVVLAEAHDALIIKTGQWFYIWVPAAAGNYEAAQDSTSHYYICDGETVEDRVIDPKGSIEGPCADPAYYAIFDNSTSTVPIRFRFRWTTMLGPNKIVKLVPAGAMYTTVQRWAKPGTTVFVGYQDPDTGVWKSLDSEIAAHGRFPRCIYTPGWSFPAV
jgi:hypothetical protein